MAMTNILKKLTVRDMNIAPGVLIVNMEYGQTVVVARIYGSATKYKTAASKFSTSDLPREDHKFYGNFEGHNLITGEVFNAPICYLPGAAPDALANAIDASEGDAVEFGIEIAVKKTKKGDGTDGYQFGVAIPKEPNAADPLAAMREKMGALPNGVTPALLAAPVAEEASKPPKAKKVS